MDIAQPLFFKYAIDPLTFDMVVGGKITRSDNASFTFLYWIDEASCSVSWHYLIEDTTLGQIMDLSINSALGRVYGLGSNIVGSVGIFLEVIL